MNNVATIQKVKMAIIHHRYVICECLVGGGLHMAYSQHLRDPLLYTSTLFLAARKTVPRRTGRFKALCIEFEIL